MTKPKKSYPAYQEAQILWECDFPSKPHLLQSLLAERITIKDTVAALEEREGEINRSLLAFFNGNRIPGTVYDGHTIAVKAGVTVTVDKEALALAGVPVETINRCVKRTEWETVECRRNGKEEA